jgi:protease-4
MNVLLTALMVGPLAWAEVPDPAGFTPPAASLAGEDGAGATWVNPANLGFDPDAGLALYYRQGLDQSGQQFVLTSGAGGLGVALHHRRQDGVPWWGLRGAFALQFPENVRAGIAATWNLPGGASPAFLSWDVGISARPLPWLGLAAVARNLGSPSPDKAVYGTYGLGAVIRPLGDKLMLGLEYQAIEPSIDDLTERQTLRTTLRIIPRSGLVIHGQGDWNVDPSSGLSGLSVGLGLEVFLGNASVGGFAGESLQSATAWLATSDTEQWLLSPRKQVPVFDLTQPHPYQASEGLLAAPTETYLKLLDRLDKASQDRSVRGVVVELGPIPFSLAQVQELRGAISRVRAADRPVVAYMSAGAGNAAYMIAAGCDRIYLHPAGDLNLVGLSAEVQYLKGTADLVGVEQEFAWRGEYKSATESNTRTEPSGPAKEQMEALLDDLYGNLLRDASSGRRFTEEEMAELIDGGPYTAAEALDLGLVDALLYPDELEDAVADLFDSDFELEEFYGLYPDTSGWESAHEIAIIYVTGSIVSGESSSGGLIQGSSTGADTVVRQLNRAAKDRRVAAVVMRVDSPGGSAFASDEIWRAVEQFQLEDKPVIVSMGGTAASGGYYVACGADLILAEPTTITGSIGVYGGKLNFSELYETLGVTHHTYSRGRNSGMFTNSRAFDPVEYAALDRLIGETYRQFKERVAEGRGMTEEEVEAVARGRVWSGERALEIGLVDEIGGFQDAIDYARVYAGLAPDAEVTLVSYGGSGGLNGVYLPQSVRAALDPGIDLPPELLNWVGYLPLTDERILTLMPWQIEVE